MIPLIRSHQENSIIGAGQKCWEGTSSRWLHNTGVTQCHYTVCINRVKAVDFMLSVFYHILLQRREKKATPSTIGEELNSDEQGSPLLGVGHKCTGHRQYNTAYN